MHRVSGATALLARLAFPRSTPCGTLTSMENASGIIAAASTVITTIVVIAGVFYAHMQLKEAAANRKMQFLWKFYEEYRSTERTVFRDRVIKGEVDPVQVTGGDYFLLWREIDDLEFLGVLLAQELVDQEWVATLFYYSPSRM